MSFSNRVSSYLKLGMGATGPVNSEVLSVLDFEKFLEGNEEQIGGRESAFLMFLLAFSIDLKANSVSSKPFRHLLPKGL